MRVDKNLDNKSDRKTDKKIDGKADIKVDNKKDSVVSSVDTPEIISQLLDWVFAQISSFVDVILRQVSCVIY